MFGNQIAALFISFFFELFMADRISYFIYVCEKNLEIRDNHMKFVFGVYKISYLVYLDDIVEIVKL